MSTINLVNDLVSCFHPSSVDISERARIVEIKFESHSESIPTYQIIKEKLLTFPSRDKFVITIKDIAQNFFSIVGNANEEEEQPYKEFYDGLDNKEIITITISIDKNIEDHKISIYNYESFSQWISAKNLLNIMEIFNDLLNKQPFLVFEIFDSDIMFSTNTMLFISAYSAVNEINFPRAEQLDKCFHISNFYSSSCHELIPEDFHINTNYSDNPFNIIFKRIETLLSIVYIANSAYIDNGTIYLQIIGQRTASFSYDLKNNFKKSNEELCGIYHWAFTDGNPVDKVGIARNIISLHCKYNDLLLTDDKTFASIQSNFSIYQKKNVESYLELKNKLAEFIIQLVNQTGELISRLSDRLRNNVVAFFTFIVTVFLVNIVSKNPLSNIFTKDITILTYLILCGSILYLIISVSEMDNSLSRIKKGYDALKNNYNEILDQNDIKSIFDNDRVLNEATFEVKKQRGKIVVIWVVLLIAIFSAVEYLSSSPLILPIIIKAFKWLSSV
jgi:hypothetical protein